MKQTFITLVALSILGVQQLQSQTSETETTTPPATQEESQDNVTEEVITKIIRIKGANGEEKVIKQQQVISTKSNIQFNPEDENKTNMDATYTAEKVTVKNYGKTSSEKLYTSIPDRDGFIFTFLDENGERMGKAKPLSSANGYYLIHTGANDHCVGHIDDQKNLILETFNTKKDSIVTLVYKLQ